MKTFAQRPSLCQARVLPPSVEAPNPGMVNVTRTVGSTHAVQRGSPLRPSFYPTLNQATRILAHDGYRIVIDGEGNGSSTHDGYRLIPGLAGTGRGFGLLLEDLSSGDSTWISDLARGPLRTSEWLPGRVESTGRWNGLEVRTETLVVPKEATEIVVLRVRAETNQPRRLRLTTVVDVALDHPDAFDSHPVFSKLFLQTERNDALHGVLLRRRPRSPLESHPVLVHGVSTSHVPVSWIQNLWCETDRAVLFGRSLPFAGDDRRCILRGTSGNTLDPVLALQLTIDVPVGQETTCAFLLAVAPDPPAAWQHLAGWQEFPRVESALIDAGSAARDRLHTLEIDVDDAREMESLGAAILRGDRELTQGRSAPVSASSSAWAQVQRLGIHGGVPFVLIDQGIEPATLDYLSLALRYWHELGLPIRVLALANEVDSRAQHLGELFPQAAPDLMQIMRDPVSAEAMTLLRNLSRWEISAAPNVVGPILVDSSATPARRIDGTPNPVEDGEGATSPHRFLVNPTPPSLESGSEELEFDNGIGGFDRDGSEYVIRLTPGALGLELPPRPWVNIIANPRLGCIVSETGAGTTWYGNSREHRLTPWSNDPLLDPHEEAYYLLDEEDGRIWSVFPGPIPEPVPYEVRHGFGYTSVRHEAGGIDTDAVVFVAADEPVRITRVRLHNRGPKSRSLSLVAYSRLVLGSTRTGRARFVVTEAHRDAHALLAWNPHSGPLSGSIVFATALIPKNARGTSFTTDRASLLGSELDVKTPAQLVSGERLDGAVGPHLDPCFAQRVDLTLEADSMLEVCFLLGAGSDREEALRLAMRAPELATSEPEKSRKSWQSLFSVIQVATPARALDVMVNGWLPYQTLSCRIWGRSAFYQSGGAFGFRDQLQDASSLAYLDPAKTREQILLHASHQFVEGDVLHWWHPPTSIGIRTRFVDDLLWLPFLTAAYLRATGDRAILEERLPFLTAPLLDPGEAERFLQPSPAGVSSELYEHCCLAIDRSLHRGAHGLPLFGGGDWNDGMNRVGIGGKGESVWMGFFLIATIDAFLPYIRERSDAERERRYLDHRALLVSALNEAGWDGEWYRRGYYDDGSALGSKESDECRIDALAQAWSVISRVAPPERAEIAMDSVERKLISKKDRLIRLLTPPFVSSPRDPGYIKGYVSGVRENGGQYTHAALWVIEAMAILGRRNRAAQLLEMINPIHLSADLESVERYQLEPYVIAADVYGADPHVGRGGWSWYTGSSGWAYRIAIESLLGFRVVEHRSVLMRPVIPDDWSGFTLRYRPLGRSTSYEICVRNSTHCSEAVVAVECATLSTGISEDAAIIELRDDGNTHVVVIDLGAAIG